MATKNSYKIPVSLNRSLLDHEIGLSAGGIAAKPVPVKVLLFWATSILALFWAVRSTFVASADWWIVVLFVVLWLMFTAFLGKYNKTKEMAWTKVPVFMNYATPGARKVVTRSTSNPSGFYSVARVDNIDDSGLITWPDGTVGQAYLVVGSASILVFEEDKKAILNRVDAFFRKIDTNVELIFITTKEPQRIYRQLAHLEDINVGLGDRDPELVELMHERYDILTGFVGSTFSSIHQYLVLKGDNLEALRRAHSVLSAETEDSSLMIKQAVMLDRDEAADALSVFFRAPDHT